MNKGIIWIVTFLIFLRLHTNIKFKAMFKINIVIKKIIHVFIDFNGNHHKKIEWTLRRLWIHNGLLKWQHYICHIEKNEKCGFKKYVKIKNKGSSNEKSINECIETFLIYINFLKWCDCCKCLFLRVHSLLKNLIFCMDFLINHIFKDIHKLAYINIYD